MRFWVSSRFVGLIFCAALSAVASTSAQALLLQEFKPASGQKIGIYIGTFDPLHETHEERIRDALTKGGLDAVVVIPNDRVFGKPNASPLADRLPSLHARFRDSTKIVVPEDARYGSPLGPEVLKFLKQTAPKDVKFVGIYGSDVAGSTWKRWIERAFLNSVDEWLVFDREGEGVSRVPGRVGRRPVRIIRGSPGETSSTEIRARIRANPGASSIPGLNDEVWESIRARGLYGAMPPERPTRLDDPGIQWKTGQVIGVSNRAGGTPFFVQLATHSPIDHVAVVVVEDGIPFAYEFTNAGGVQRVSVEKLLERSRDRKGATHAILSEPTQPLSISEESRLVDFLRGAAARQAKRPAGIAPEGPQSCSQLVHSAFKSAGREVGRIKSLDHFDSTALGGKTLALWRNAIKSSEDLIPPDSIFWNGMRQVAGDFPVDTHWSEERFLEEWSNTGSFERLARMKAIHERKVIQSPVQIQQATEQLVAELRASLKAPKSPWVLTCEALFSIFAADGR